MGYMKQYWRHILSIIAIIVMALWSHSNIVPSQDRNYAECTRDAHENTLNKIDFDRSINPTTKAEAEKYKNQYIQLRTGCSDLAAQWRMSDITERAFWAGTIGLIFLAITLIESASAANMTKKALFETETANKRGQRAYLAVTEIRTRAARKNFPVTIAVVVKNVGMTPAHNIKIGRIFEIEDSDGVLLRVLSAKSGNWGSLGPQITKTAEMDITNADILSGIVAGQIRIRVSGVVDYKDIFRKEQITLFNASLCGPPSIYSQSFSISRDRNGMT